MKSYLEIVKKVLDKGILQENRTNTKAYAIAGAMFEHDMAGGFPILTTKRVPFRLVASELEFFIKGLTDKRWLQERNNHIWAEWCSPSIVPYSPDDPEIQAKMRAESDLGPIYGKQWRDFAGIDQLAELIIKLHTDLLDRRMIVSAWNPADLHKMALPPCHYSFQVTVTDNRLNLLWNQRSVDVALGLPFNIASYGLLLHLLALTTGFMPGKLIGFLADTHIYENHVEGLKKQLQRKPNKLPYLYTEYLESIFDWTYTDSELKGYYPGSSIPFKIAV